MEFRARLTSLTLGICERLTSSESFSQLTGKCSAPLRWLPYCRARSSPIPGDAAITGTPLVTTVINSSIDPKPSRSPIYRCICAASTDGATRDPSSALATSPTTPLYFLVKVVQTSVSLYSSTGLPRETRFPYQVFLFSCMPALCH